MCLQAALLPRSRTNASCTYSFQNLVLFPTVKGLTEAGVPVRQIRRVLECLQRQLGDSQAMTSLKIYASSKGVVVWDGESSPLTRHILLTTRFKPCLESQPTQIEVAQVWFELAMALQDDSLEEAA